ncbi:ABC transporter substrate-binding protein [Nitratireductor aquimarinus]|uniref:ABC transporter substrate-binding protein n=1 Tax=Nitratireductor TaxID=245876 RepID=UPI0019D38D2D|nr:MULTISPECIES: ABC transporter substrate-binding protein [Nitratireductor]MBN7775432.1 ABC transporter substrate-binding protein [Nitratireductor pacificus]MBN7782102.1 ABC transporter substrate-binding protein [Nitratireductor pacificus]MBN7790909.1 ABC transporter substrate-binding protein [Nitratireductor aquimarinus]MBY6100726.1 ABC transporter substrate-binding protein [Nitratireductor aquimarinus]MCA1262773.1 ABC transporter substrate-binding protein [Nitratireductor aquimarinus]
MSRLIGLRGLAVAGFVLVSAPAFADEAGFPYTDENCGYTTTHEAPPARAVTLSNNATEMMLALGLEDRMAGTSYMANLKISPQYEAAYNTVPVLSPLVATTEQLIEAEADFVYAGYPDGFSESRHTRDQLHDLGMKTRLNTEGCNLGKFGFEELYAEIRSMSAIFGVRERGEALIVDIEERLAEVEAKLDGVEAMPVFIFNGGESAPRAVLGNTMLSHVVERAGGANIFGDVANRYGQVSWEQIAERAPEYIVVYYSGTAGGQVVGDPAGELGQARIEILKANPTVENVPGISGEKFVTIDSVWGQPGPSSIDAVEKLARAFHPDRTEK